MTRENAGSPDRQSFGRGLDYKKIKIKIVRTIWKKPQLPPEVPLEATADGAAKSDLQDENPRAKAQPYKLVETSPDRVAIKLAKKLTKSTRKKLKAPGSDGEDSMKIEDQGQVRIEKKIARDREVLRDDPPRSAEIDPGTDQWDRPGR